VIGKSGRNIEAIRALVRAASVKDHLRVNVEVITEDEREERVKAEESTV
jgi:ribosomal protein S3